MLLAGNYKRQYRTAKDSTARNGGNKEFKNVDKMEGQKNIKQGKMRGRKQSE
jgi:hypothetical protein